MHFYARTRRRHRIGQIGGADRVAAIAFVPASAAWTHRPAPRYSLRPAYLCSRAAHRSEIGGPRSTPSQYDPVGGRDSPATRGIRGAGTTRPGIGIDTD